MAIVTMRQLLEAGIHFGHQTRRWNPKMARFIFGQRNGIYIIDLQQTLRQLNKAYAFVRDTVASGGQVLFVGTKKQAQEAITREAERCGMFYISHHWLGGTLTNYMTIRKSIKRLLDLEDMQARGDLEKMTKKEAIGVVKTMEKLNRNLCGIKTMERLPDVVFIIDTKKEAIAVREAQRLNIPCIGIVDTNCDPDQVPIPIPGNDDAIRAVNLFCRVIADAAVEGKAIGEKARATQAAAKKGAAAQPAATATARPQETAPEETKTDPAAEEAPAPEEAATAE